MGPDLRGMVDVVDGPAIDWAHTPLQDGTFTTDVTLMVQACSDNLEVAFADIQSFLEDGWFFPDWAKNEVQPAIQGI